MLTTYEVAAGDFTLAGNVSSQVKRSLKQLGIPPKTIKRITVALFEAEVNMIAYSVGGRIDFEVTPDKVFLRIADDGPGIPDLAQAMEEGWSTATDEIREMGFGAGMGLPNIRKNADGLEIDTGPGRGTEIRLTFLLDGGREAG